MGRESHCERGHTCRMGNTAKLLRQCSCNCLRCVKARTGEYKYRSLKDSDYKGNGWVKMSSKDGSHKATVVLTLGNNGVLAVSLVNPNGDISRRHIINVDMTGQNTTELPDNY